MADAAVACDLQVIEREAHTLKSSASTFGAVRLAQAVRTLERTCRTEDAAAVERMSGAISALVEEAADAYRALGLISANEIPAGEVPAAEVSGT